MLLDGMLDHHRDIQGTLRLLRTRLGRGDRVALVGSHPYLKLAQTSLRAWLHARSELPMNLVTESALSDLSQLAGYERVHLRRAACVPVRALGWGKRLNPILGALPGVRSLGWLRIALLRPVGVEHTKPSLSIVASVEHATRDIEMILQRLQNLNREIDLEVIFLLRRSNSAAGQEAARIVEQYRGQFELKVIEDATDDRGDVMSAGFDETTKDLITALPSGVATPTSALERLYEAYVKNHGDMIHSSAIVYPREGDEGVGDRWARVLRALAAGAMLDVSEFDCSGGLQMLARRDYERIAAWARTRAHRSPNGDLTRLMGALVLGVGTRAIPLRVFSVASASERTRFRTLWRTLIMEGARIRTGASGAPTSSSHIPPV